MNQIITQVKTRTDGASFVFYRGCSRILNRVMRFVFKRVSTQRKGVKETASGFLIIKLHTCGKNRRDSWVKIAFPATPVRSNRCIQPVNRYSGGKETLRFVKFFYFDFRGAQQSFKKTHKALVRIFQ